jgi:hypothetical protein
MRSREECFLFRMKKSVNKQENFFGAYAEVNRNRQGLTILFTVWRPSRFCYDRRTAWKTAGVY